MVKFFIALLLGAAVCIFCIALFVILLYTISRLINWANNNSNKFKIISKLISNLFDIIIFTIVILCTVCIFSDIGYIILDTISDNYLQNSIYFDVSLDI